MLLAILLPPVCHQSNERDSMRRLLRKLFSKKDVAKESASLDLVVMHCDGMPVRQSKIKELEYYRMRGYYLREQLDANAQQCIAALKLIHHPVECANLVRDIALTGVEVEEGIERVNEFVKAMRS